MPVAMGNLAPPPGFAWFGGTEPNGPFGPDCNGVTWFQNFALPTGGGDAGPFVVGYTGAITSSPSTVIGNLTDGRGTLTFNPVDKKLYFLLLFFFYCHLKNEIVQSSH